MFLLYIDLILFIVTAVFVGYDLFFVIISFFPKPVKSNKIDRLQTFAIIFPAYKEDNVIVDSVTQILKQDYPSEKYTVIVVSDKMENETNQQLAQFPILLHIVDFEISLKSKAITYALDQLDGYDQVIIMDADNITNEHFLTDINKVTQSNIAMQLHRTRKNANTPIAVWDGIAEEINNTIYRKGHVQARLSAALIGSGMVFKFDWLKENMSKCVTFAEDRELEVMLAKENIFVDYDNSIYVYDEKTSHKDTLLRQRTRWAHAQFIAFNLIFKNIRRGKLSFKILDKAFQWIPFPKQLRLLIILVVAIPLSFFSINLAPKWWCLLMVQIITLALAIPKNMYNKELFISLTKLPFLILILLKSYLASFRRIWHKDMSFNNTPHSATTFKKE